MAEDGTSSQIGGTLSDSVGLSLPAVPSGEPLPPERLYTRCDLGDLPFATVDELPDPPGLIGQERAVEAVRLSIGVRAKGFNLFALGSSGTGRHTLVREMLERQAATEPTPSDLCYINNFGDPRRPKHLSLPAGRARGLREAMEHLIAELRATLPAAFEREEYRARREVLDQQLKKRHEEAFGGLQKRAEEKGVALIRTPVGLALAPVENGEVVGSEEFKKLTDEKRERIKADIDALQAELEAIIRSIPEWERQHRDAVRALNREITATAVGHLLAEVRGPFADLPDVQAHLDAVEHDILGNAEDFMAVARQRAEESGASDEMMAELPTFRRYQVNVLVDHDDTKGAPVIYEDHPTHQMLVGRVEHLARFGALVTDFNMIVPGALLRANGGYLMVDVERLLNGSFGYDSLKRALRSGVVRIESLEQMLSLSGTVSLEPEPVPLDVKVVLVGAPIFYYLLSAYDPDFPQLFKVAADFDDRVERNGETAMLYARTVAAAVRRHKLRPLDRRAVERTIEHAARSSGDAERLSTELRAMVDLLHEADHAAGLANKLVIGEAEIGAAIAARRRRSDRIYRRILEEIGRDTIRIETAGERVGQINGLAVMGPGDQAFGHPTRISAQVHLGHGEVVDIEREVALGGPIHSKGVLILAGYLGGRFGKAQPLSLSASLVFEQSYGGIEGDSASSAELYALLSALAEVPIRQCFAVTGSVDQSGNVQAIGGVNEKIEGFFDVCHARGLDGGHGVLIPAANVKHLMLRADVVEACRAGQFRVIPVETIDQGIELLTGLPAGGADMAGRYPEGTVNARVARRLASFAERTAREAPPKRRERPRRGPHDSG